MTENAVTWHTAKLPGDVNTRLLEKRSELARLLGVRETKVSVSGDTLRYLLDTTALAESMGIQGELPQAQP